MKTYNTNPLKLKATLGCKCREINKRTSPIYKKEYTIYFSKSQELKQNISKTERQHFDFTK